MVFSSELVTSVSISLKLCRMSGMICVLYATMHVSTLLLHSRQDRHFYAKKAKIYINITSSVTILYTTFFGLFFNIIVQLYLYASATCQL